MYNAHMAVPRHILHVDMDAFYASVEVLDDPSLKGKPVIVGGEAKARGVVSAASYEVRRFGVHSAMPMVTAMRLCPHAVILPVRMSRYIEVSRSIRDIFDKYTTLVEPISVDEAFLDVTESARLYGGAEALGRAIKAEIRDKLHLTASVGVAPNKFLAKVASDLEKPDGFTVITPQTVHAILDPLSVGKIWGVGKTTERLLRSRGIETIGQLRAWPPESLRVLVGNYAEDLLALANGIDERPVETARDAKSISSEETFPKDIGDAETLLGVLLGQVEEVSARLREDGLRARTITLKLRYGDFRTLTRSQTLPEPTDITQTLWQEARKVFTRWKTQAGGPLRLLGFGVSGLDSGPGPQGMLFSDAEDDKQKRLDQAMDGIRRRFGKDSVRRGRKP
jgi:DNA polymerase IV